MPKNKKAKKPVIVLDGHLADIKKRLDAVSRAASKKNEREKRKNEKNP